MGRERMVKMALADIKKQFRSYVSYSDGRA